jgi:hypothetical protein
LRIALVRTAVRFANNTDRGVMFRRRLGAAHLAVRT